MSTSMAPKKLMFSLCAGRCGPGPRRRRAGRGAHRLHRQAVILGRPGHHRVRHEGQAPRLLGLLLQMAGAHHALVRIQEVPLQSVQRVALVELPGDLAPIRRVGQVAGSVDRSPQRPVLLERRGQRVLATGRRELTDQQRGSRSNKPKLTSVTPCVSVACSVIGMSVALPRISSSGVDSKLLSGWLSRGSGRWSWSRRRGGFVRSSHR